jgi:hypothetical protein
MISTQVMLRKVNGKEGEPETLDLDKLQMLKRIEKAHSNKKSILKSAEAKVLSVEIDPNNRQAKVKNSLFGKFVLNLESAEGKREVPAEQNMICEDVIALSDDDVLQLIDGKCDLFASIGLKADQAAEEKKAQ